MSLVQQVPGLFLDLLILSVKGTLVALLVLAVQKVLGKRLPPAWRCALWLLVLGRLLLPQLPESPLSVLGLGGLSAAGAAAIPGLSELSRGVGSGIELASEPARADLGPIHFLAALWCLGLFLFLMRKMRSVWQLRLLLLRARPVRDRQAIELLDQCRAQMRIGRQVQLLASAEIGGPAIIGWWRPRILLPSTLSAHLGKAGLRHVLLHELAHLRRADGPLDLLASVVFALHWFNPLLRLAQRRLRADMEIACDARALSCMPGTERNTYGRTLLDLIAKRSQGTLRLSTAGMGFATPRQELKRRIRMIANDGREHRWGGVRVVALLLVLALVTLTETSLPTRALASNDQPAAPPSGMALSVMALREAGTQMFSWAEAQARKSGNESFEAREAPERIRWSECPTISWQELSTLLANEALPKTDGWGNPLQYCLDRDLSRSWGVIGVRSPGADGRYEGDRYRAGSFSGGAETHRDLVWVDGYFFTWPAPG